MNTEAFALIAESLRQYRRAELREFQKALGGDPIETLYVDPLPGDAVLRAVLSSNTTFLLGRKGTGKSTIFAKAQAEYRRSRDVLSVYVDVKSLYELITPSDSVPVGIVDEVDPGICRAHLLRKAFLGTVISELIAEVDKTCDTMGFLERFRGVRRSFTDLQTQLKALAARVRHASLETHELPILQKISRKWRSQNTTEHRDEESVQAGGSLSANAAKISGGASVTEFDKTLEDAEVYKEYSEVVLQAYPFVTLLNEIKDLLDEARLTRLVVFFDDFSELNLIDQKLFVDVVLSPLNNASNESVKLKIAGAAYTTVGSIRARLILFR